MMTMVEKLNEVGSKLPPPALAKLLDFAEPEGLMRAGAKLKPPALRWQDG